jgi:hypothetical protein
MSTDLPSRLLLAVIGVGFLGGYALPLLFAPLRWATWLRWSLPTGSQSLTVYFGRCVGALALVITGLTLRAALAPRAHVETVELLIGTGAVMTALHVWGAVEGSQPKSETAEVALYLALTVMLCFARVSLACG